MNILLIIGGVVGALLLFTLVKKLIKMMFLLITVLIFGLGVFFFLYQDNPKLFSAPSVSGEPDTNQQKRPPLAQEDRQKVLEATEELRQQAAEQVNQAVRDAQQIMQENLKNRRPRPSQQDNTEKDQE